MILLEYCPRCLRSSSVRWRWVQRVFWKLASSCICSWESANSYFLIQENRWEVSFCIGMWQIVAYQTCLPQLSQRAQAELQKVEKAFAAPLSAEALTPSSALLFHSNPSSSSCMLDKRRSMPVLFDVCTIWSLEPGSPQDCQHETYQYRYFWIFICRVVMLLIDVRIVASVY